MYKVMPPRVQHSVRCVTNKTFPPENNTLGLRNILVQLHDNYTLDINN